MSRCNKCGQGDPHLSDSWCLACTSLEALNGELRLAWGSPGTRILATDLLVSSVRQVRALRRLGIAGAGRIRASSPAAAVPGRAASVAPNKEASQAPPDPPSAPPREVLEKKDVKEEEADAESYYSDSADGSGDEGGKPKDPAEDAPGLTAVPKAKADCREEIPRRRRGEGEVEQTEADSSRATSTHREKRQRTPRRDEREDRHLRSRERQPSWERERIERARRDIRRRTRSRSRHHRDGKGQQRGGRKKRKHRAGSRHQRLYRAHNDPHRRFHHRPPDAFWDRPPSPP
jgi:hypothetical protein